LDKTGGLYKALGEEKEKTSFFLPPGPHREPQEEVLEMATYSTRALRNQKPGAPRHQGQSTCHGPSVESIQQDNGQPMS